MQLRDYVRFNSDFRDSVNLYLDLNKVDKIKSYIPTKSSVDILEQYLDAVLDNKQHSTLLLDLMERENHIFCLCYWRH